MKAIKIYFKHKKNDLLFFKTEDNQEVIIPSKYVNFEMQEGSSIYLKIQKKLIEEENKKEVAKAVLEEILNGNN